MKPISASETRSRAFYDSIAGDYDRMLDTPEMRAIRTCFWRCAEAVIPQPSRLLDFGAGSGLDAEHFAAQGHEVTAYDPSEGMLDRLRARCAAQVAQGSIVPVRGTLHEARQAIAARAPFDAITCNFAVFSMIAQLEPQFGLFGDWARPGGTVLASIQNPWHAADLRTRAFWRSLLAMPFTGVMRYPSAQLGHTFHHTPGQVCRAARPMFVVEPPPSICDRRHFGRWSAFRLVVLRRV